MSAHAKHHFHMVNPSPWPALGAFGALVLAFGGILFFHKHSIFGEGAGVPPIYNLVPGFALVILTMVLWWRDVIKESVKERAHTEEVSHGLRMGMVLFIASEVMFFFAFFWAFFHNALGFSTSTLQWPPSTIAPLDAWEIPFYNTVILLTSGGTVTRAHLFIERGDNKAAARWIFITAALGALFLTCQAYEYIHATFSLTDGIYPSTFFLATGFHGFHVFVGTVFLIVCGFRASKDQFRPHKHIGFQAAAWYWHFVDVVWLFLFTWVYWLLGLPVRSFTG
jgi:cytochrome c oxidase subunit 3